jgi:hypothetical protein
MEVGEELDSEEQPEDYPGRLVVAERPLHAPGESSSFASLLVVLDLPSASEPFVPEAALGP